METPTEKKKKRLKKPIPTEYDSEIEIFLRKNRMFSKTKKVTKTEVDIYSYIDDTLKKANENDSIKYFIIQLGLLENAVERFLYTNDTYVLIIKENELFDFLQLKDYSSYTNLFIYFFSEKGGITADVSKIIKERENV